MTIQEIYSKYNIPINLQQHMLLTAKTAIAISEHWNGIPFNHQKIILACLLHDLGNLIKFDLKKYPEFLGEESKNRQFWKRTQEKMIAAYGSDEHLATEKMLKELHINSEVIRLILEKTFANACTIEKVDDWPLKILLYCDFRVGPYGILPLKERVKELMERSAKYKDRSDLLDAIISIEQQIQKYTTVPLSTIGESIVVISDVPLLEINS